MIDLLATAAELFQIAHDWAFPHQEPSGESGGGTSVVLILAGVVVTLGAVAGLVWLKKRVEREDEASAPDALQVERPETIAPEGPEAIAPDA